MSTSSRLPGVDPGGRGRRRCSSTLPRCSTISRLIRSEANTTDVRESDFGAVRLQELEVLEEVATSKKPKVVLASYAIFKRSSSGCSSARLAMASPSRARELGVSPNSLRQH